MPDERYLIDTSALLAFLEDEPGVETYYVTLRTSGERDADRRHASLKQLPVTFIWCMDEPSFMAAGRIKARHKMSLADALICGLAVSHRAVLVHRDPAFDVLADEFAQEKLPREPLQPEGKLRQNVRDKP